MIARDRHLTRVADAVIEAEIRMWCGVREGRCRKKGLFFP